MCSSTLPCPLEPLDIGVRKKFRSMCFLELAHHLYRELLLTSNLDPGAVSLALGKTYIIRKDSV